MYLDGKLLDSIAIEPETPGSLYILQQKLEDKHSGVLDLSKEDPQYFIEGIGSRVNAEILNEPKKIIKN